MFSLEASFVSTLGNAMHSVLISIIMKLDRFIYYDKGESFSGNEER